MMRFLSKYSRRLLLLAFMGTGLPLTGAEVDPIRISLISEAKTIAPGQKFSIGILQELRPGYHSYWKNPGTIGLPLSIYWELPQGFKTNEIQWPTPETPRMAAYDVWGYRNEALMVIDLQAPANLKPGTTVTIAGNAVWMCCGTSCHPGHKKLKLRLPVGERIRLDKKWQVRFDRTRADQPKASRHWKMSCSVDGSNYRLSVSSISGRRVIPRDFRFHDYDRQISSEKGQTVARRTSGGIIFMHQEENTGKKLARLRGILVADTEWEAGVTVLSVDVPIQGRDKQ